MKTIEIIFKPTKLLDSRKYGSTLELGQELVGNMQLSNSCVSWEDCNGQQWAFWIGDTAELVEIKSRGEEADLYRFFLELKENYEYWGFCTITEIKDFCRRNKIEFNVTKV
ncbi:hypothetical protein [Epilithonimonas caeni]|uniref:hypothetical protein n=1 Tax=Epilithonimonas caeni TaxID=365343 RepID=UPI000482F949|nr:hypothetical protein [Epilithonimonas caeni]